MVAGSNMKGNYAIGSILGFSTVICGIISLVILFYINSFIMKRRKKEFGLYSILGMEKRHISIVMFNEILLTAAISIICGIIGGALLSQLLFLLLLKIVGIPAALTFQIPISSVITTILLFGAGFVIVLLFDMFVIVRTDPINLLHSSKEGEREPKARWLLALIGIITLAIGYWLSLTIKTPSDALSVFFLAVLLVIVGTYCLFIAGSILLLKILRKNKKFYYKPKNFISVSGMIYRMKQNATGLANICILSTCVLVTLSSCVCLNLGEEDCLKGRFPRQVMTECIANEQSSKIMQTAANAHADKYGFKIQNAVGYYNANLVAKRTGSSFNIANEYTSTTYAINAILLSDYNRITGANETLKDGEILVYMEGEPIQGKTITLEKHNYAVKKLIAEPNFIDSYQVINKAIMVVPKLSDLEKLRIENEDHEINKVWYNYNYDVTGDSTKLSAFYKTMRSDLNKTVPHLSVVNNIDSAREDFYAIYGSVLFVGIFFVSLFLIATVLIIYYKQITEGFDDHDRFKIMQNVGMSDKEVRSTIQKQVLLVFFLPLGMAVIHIAFAFRVLCKLLVVFGMNNPPFFLLCTLGAILVFTILYFVVYQLTARTYYKIVQGNA